MILHWIVIPNAFDSFVDPDEYVDVCESGNIFMNSVSSFTLLIKHDRVTTVVFTPFNYYESTMISILPSSEKSKKAAWIGFLILNIWLEFKSSTCFNCRMPSISVLLYKPTFLNYLSLTMVNKSGNESLSISPKCSTGFYDN